jgi:hypothetical protein
MVLAAAAFFVFGPVSIQRQADRIQHEVVAIRGLPFLRPVPVEVVSRQQMREHMARESRRAPRIDHFWDVVRMLGLYRGPDLGPPEDLGSTTVDFVGGMYDARADAFYMAEGLDDSYQAVGIAHELTHALQDQHFDMVSYLLDRMRDPDANGDEVYARQAVVEGEAAYVDSIYQVGLAGNTRPSRQQIRARIVEQGEWNPENWQRLLQNPGLSAGERMAVQGAIDARKRMPPFLFEFMAAAKIDGMKFIEAVQQRGWPEVAKLYGEYPPVSTEQILHPEKWFAREAPASIRWPSFDTDPLFSDWRLLQENVMGERGWQFVFREHGIRTEAIAAAAGWNGDRLAVFKDKNRNAFLMLLCTSWDTPADAAEFAEAYARLLAAKYPEGAMPTRVQLRGSEVQIVEGGPAESLDAFMAFNATAVIGAGGAPEQ